MAGNLKDYATGIIATAPSPATSGTSLVLQTGQGSRMPATPFFATTHPQAEMPDLDTAEKVLVTNVTGDTLTIVRAQGETTAKSIATGWRLSNSLFTKDIEVSNYNSNGCISIPTFTDNSNGTVTIGSGQFQLSSNADGSGDTNKYTVSGGTFSLTDLTLNYIVVNYNSGTPVMQVITDVTLINETTIIPVYSIFRNGTFLHTQNWDSLGLALANKVHQSIVKTQRYRRESGLSLSETGTRNLVLTTGKVWTGAVPIVLDQVATATDNLFFWYHSGGNWTSSLVAQYNNTQYDNGTALTTLTTNRYAVNWVFRGVESQKHLYIVLGTGDYTLSEAQGASIPALPPAITSHAVLVGKIIIQKSAATATSIQSAFDTQFSSATPTDHNSLTNLQGGSASEYYHLTSAQATVVGNTSGTNTGDQTGGTPALTLGTANTAGTSTSFIRRDDTILAFDATALTAEAIGSTSSVGTATTAARRDHRHPMPTALAMLAGVGGGYAACATAIGTAAKTVALTGYSLVVGGTIGVTFTNGNSAAAPTLNINSAGAKPIFTDGVAALTIPAGFQALLMYDGTNYNVINDGLGTTVATTQAFGDTAVAGVALENSHVDHKHAMPASPKDTTAQTGFLKGNGTTISGVVTVTNPATSAPSTPTDGMLWWDTDDTTGITSGNADTVDNFNASATPTANTLLPLDANTSLASYQQAWQYPTPQNSWVNYGGTYATIAYMKDTLGFVHIKGAIKSGTTTAGTIVFVLPAGYRPAEDNYYPAVTQTSGAAGSFQIEAAGNIKVIVANNAFFSFGQTVFKAEA